MQRVKERFMRTPFFEYFMSEVNLLSNFDLYVCTLTSVQLPGVTNQAKFFDSRLQVWAITGMKFIYM